MKTRSISRPSVALAMPFLAICAAMLVTTPAAAERNDRRGLERTNAERVRDDRAAPMGDPRARIDRRDVLAQSAARPMPSPGYNRRPVSDQDHAMGQRDTGQIRPLGELHRSARMVGRGEYLGVEPDIQRGIYRFKFLRPGGNVVWVDVDGRTGRVVAERP